MANFVARLSGSFLLTLSALFGYYLNYGILTFRGIFLVPVTSPLNHRVQFVFFIKMNFFCMKMILFLFFSVLFFDCQPSVENEDASKNSAPENENIAGTNASDSIKIFDHFDDMQHFFSRKNDTTYVINFWATWCKPCVEEMPYFEQLHEKYRDQKVKILLVSLDFKKQIDSKLKPFIRERNLQPEVVVLADPDANSWISKVDENWGGAIPITIVYKGEQRQFIGEQFEDYQSLEKIIQSFL
ncbi:MAG TPA: TlpA disulfide reductase family protein [Saprospiraceae bacterium]|nr:TlpA disulfide reductase family protein [Saprospiraceae bacterium]